MACLRTLTQLRTKHVDFSSLCPLCLGTDETIVHCLVTCQMVQLVWNRVGIGTIHTIGTSFLNWCMDCFKVLNVEQKCLLVTLCWAIWGARNDLVWNGKNFSADNIVAYAKGYLDQWRNARNCRIKVNVDASIFEESRSFRIGRVARDDKVLLLEGVSLLKRGVIQPFVAEALGVKEALSWIKEKGWIGVHVESDCLMVIQALRSATNMISLFGSIVNDANRVVYSFARAAILYSDSRFSLESVPTDLLPMLVTEFNG
ncbi:uncharacterized protein LOC133034186 [Cannabis sativa]|uniref:uncharacterized protein LOC133034186 n=1 Tax=Cannabis sativa TaxID=3483 RepID=UPI0029CA5BA5|nr:uncharacterized protein LOC133034186 [Cannabis sativa]